MSSSALASHPDIRVREATVTGDELVVALMDGRTILVPLAWYPRLANAEPSERANLQIAGGGYGIHWPDLDGDLDTKGLLLGHRAPPGSELWRSRALS